MFALGLTAAKFVFSNSGNFRAKANPPKPRSCPKRRSGNDWGPIPVLTGYRHVKSVHTGSGGST